MTESEVAAPPPEPQSARPEAIAARNDANRAVHDDVRLATVRETGLLDSAAEPAFDRLTRLAVRLVGVPTAFFSLVDETRDFYKSACGFGDALQGARELSGPTFCQYAIRSRAPLVIPDTAADPVYREVPTVRTLGVAAYVGVPIVIDGHAIGSFCVIDTVPRAWTVAEVEVLTELAASAEREIALRLAAETSQRLAEQLQDQASELEQQIEEALRATEDAHILAEELEQSAAVLEVERRRLADVFDQAPTFLAVLHGREHVFALANDAYYKLVGRREIVGRPLIEALPELRTQGFVELLDDVLATGVPFVGRELPLSVQASAHVAPEQRYVDFIYMPIVEGNGDRTGVIAHGTDVTESVEARRRIERLLEDSERARVEALEARRVAEQASRTKAAFLGTMSHEFRTPLNAIGGYAQLLDLEIAGPLNAGQREHLTRLRASNEHMLQLVNDVLDLAKLDADALHFRADTALAEDAAADAIALTAPQAAVRGVRLINDIAGPSLSYVGDAQRVRQVLVNLLSNAIKFSEPGSDVHLSSRAIAEASPVGRVNGTGPWTVLEVRDDGVGIAPEFQASVFEPFKQVEDGHTRTKGGTGLGLAISRRLARNMGGDLTLESALGAGSCFRLWLPASTESGSSSREPAGDRDRPGDHDASSPARPHAHALTDIGHRLRDDVEAMLDAWTARLRADGAFPLAESVPVAALEDHTLVFLANVVESLAIIDQTGGSESDLMTDSDAIQRLISECHGRQRRRLGWTEAQLAREYLFHIEELASRVRGYAAREPEDAALAIGILTRLLHHARDAAIGAYRSAG